MASAITHAALPVIVLAAVDVPRPLRRRVMIAAAIAAVVPDLDLATALFEIRPTDPAGHRGVSHSLVMAALIGLFVTIVWFRDLAPLGRPWRRIALLLFLAVASHGLVDAFTTGESGVALLAPLTDARFSSPWKLLPSCPVGASEYLGAWGMFTVANELLYLLIPAGVVVAWLRAEDSGERRRMMRAAAIWAVMAVALRLAMPEYFAPVVPRYVRAVREAERASDLPEADLPGGALVRRWDELEARGTLGRALVPATPTWSSSFFPSWFGGEAGRWTEGRPLLVFRTLFGFAPPTEPEARSWISAAANGDAAARQRLFTLAPTEKVDIVLGRYDFPATVQGLSHSHNVKGTPRYWSGRCNGIAGAAMKHPEPFRVVEVIGVDGARVPFHPNDVKSLLAIAYDGPEVELIIGEMCPEVKLDSGAECSMNPALLVLALANRIGLARDTFLVDALPTIAKQYYAVAKARIDVLRQPYPASRELVEPEMRERVASFVDVAIELTLSSTTVSYPRADRRDDRDPSGTTYRRVGLVPVVMKYTATIGLDGHGELVAGRWTGDPPDGPDDIVVVSGNPRLVGDGMLVPADRIPWSLVRELARASADETSSAPTIDLRR